MLPESQSELSAEELISRVDNMDYELLTRVDDSPGGEYPNRCKSIRREQYEARIRQAQLLSSLALNILQGESETASTRVEALWDAIFSRASYCPSLGPLGDARSVSKVSDNSCISNSEPIIWSQRIGGSDVDSCNFELQMWDILLRICGVAVHCINSSKEVVNEADIANLKASVHSLAVSLTSSLAALRDQLCLGESTSSSKYIQFAPGSDSAVLRPSWLREVSLIEYALRKE